MSPTTPTVTPTSTRTGRRWRDQDGPGGGGPVGDRGWRDDAVCRSVDPELFFPTAQSGPAYDEQVTRAVAVCAGCAVRAACLEFALEALPDGIAGGMTPAQRRTFADSAGRRCVEKRDLVTAGANRWEVCAAGRAALRAGRAVRAVAREFGVTERTAQRWAQRVRAEQAGAEQAGAGRVREEVRAG